MKVFLGLLGAVIGALAGLFYFGSLAGDLYTRSLEFQSPDQAGDMHSLTFLLVTFATMMIGYFIGWFAGLYIDRKDRD